MTFFDETGHITSAVEWLKRYEPYYFLGGPASRRVNRRNQSSNYGEEKVCDLLNKSTILSKDDLVLLMAWKMGLIDHGSSEVLKKIIYSQNFDLSLVSRGQYGERDFSRSIPYLANNMQQVVEKVARNPQHLVDWVRGPHPELGGFGITYILTVQFFISHGKDPIYDRFAHMAAIAIHENLKPGATIKWAPVQSWEEYQRYVNLLKPISAACFQAGASSQVTVPRPLDRAAWVYGHFFEEAKPAPRIRNVSRTHLVIKASPPATVFDGVTTIRCSIDSMGQVYADGRTRVVLAVQPESMHCAPKLRLADGRVPITLFNATRRF